MATPLPASADEWNSVYLRFLKEQVRARLKDELMIVAENEVDKVVDAAIADLAPAIKTMMDPYRQRFLVDVETRRRDA